MRLIVLAAAGLAAGPALAGPLNPPAPPASTSLPLSQVEPRTPVTALPLTISSPGSYFLAGNLTGASGQSGITIAADSVTLDLRGFALLGVTGSLDGITVTGDRLNIAIANGTVRGWGSDGINATNADNSQFTGLRISNCGDNGLMTGLNCTVSRVDVQQTDTGITVDNGTVVSQCTSASNAIHGIVAGLSCRVIDCTVRLNTADGIRGGSGTLITGCTAGDNSGDGIEALGGCAVIDNLCDSQDSGANTAGIRVTGQRNRIHGNTLIDNTAGIDVDGTLNIITGNTDSSNSAPFAHTPYIIDTATNTAGPTVSGSGVIGSTVPSANFVH